MRLEIKNEVGSEYARENGIYREYYFCSSCDTKIGCKIYDKNRQFGQGTILHSNQFPSFCPNCGKQLS